MEGIKKALQDLAKAIEGNSSIKRIKVTITIEEPKQAKPNKQPK